MRTDGTGSGHLDPLVTEAALPTESSAMPSPSLSSTSTSQSSAGSFVGRLRDLVNRKRASGEESVSRGEPLDVATIGNGVTGYFTVGHIGNTRKAAPKEFRNNPQSADGGFNMAIIGQSFEGVGRAYGPRGYPSWDAKRHQVNLQDFLMEFNCGKRPPVDPELFKCTIDIEERRLNGQRPVRFAKPYTEPESHFPYYLDWEYRNPYSLAKFNRKQRFTHPSSYSGENVSRDTYRRYVLDTVKRIVAKSKRVSVRGIESEVTRVDYDKQTRLFTLTLKKAGSDELQMLTARRVVVAIGQERDLVPGVLKGIANEPHFYSGDDVYGRLLSEAREDSAQMQMRRGLLVGSGLTMNDITKSLLRLSVDNFKVVSRNGLTHELPQDMPPLRQCLGADYQPIVEELERIHEQLDPQLLAISLYQLNTGKKSNTEGSANKEESFVDRYVRKVKEGFLAAKLISASYEPSSPEPLLIRGEKFDRKLVCHALLAQYAVFRYENLRAGDFREARDEKIANEIVKRCFSELDVPYSAWITTSRTSNTDANIKVNSFLRQTDRLAAATITRVEKVGERFDVLFSNGEKETYDYIANFSGRRQVPVFDPNENANDPMVASLVDQGLIQPHPTGVGAQMDKTGRAVPDPERFGDDPTPDLFLASSLAKGELMFPTNRNRDPLSNVVSEAVPGLEPLTKQIGESIILDVTGWKPYADHELDFEYTESGVKAVPLSRALQPKHTTNGVIPLLRRRK